MLISKKWLHRHLSFDLPINELSEILTEIGLEIATIEPFEEIKGNLNGVVVGKVLTCEKHPDADKLNLTTVDIGTEVLNIVCGAPNVAQGQKVPVATVGSTIYPIGSEEGITLKKTKIRGQVSLGMICAEDELGLGRSHDGILVLDDKWEVGTPMSKVVDLTSDTVLEIELTPNRADAISHLGVARDLKAYFEVHDIPHTWHDVFDFDLNLPTESAQGSTEIKVEATDLAPIYTGVNLSEITLAPSPKWLQLSLKAIGINPKNNMVDLTNFIMHDVGQPLHAFDKNNIAGNKIVVRKATDKEKITTLDDIERELSEMDLVIADEQKPSCIAGVLGSANSGVSDTTTDIFLESAYFDAVSVRKSAKSQQINSDAAYRFERGTDPHLPEKAAKLFVKNAMELAGAKAISPIVYASNQEFPFFEYEVNTDRINRLIGTDLSLEFIANLLHALEIQTEKTSDNTLKVSVPPYRVDVTREADIAEEVLRIYGMNKVEIPTEVRFTLPSSTAPKASAFAKKIANNLTGLGFRESMTISFVDEKIAEQFTPKGLESVKIFNPLNNDFTFMRPSLFPNLLASIRHNLNFKQKDLKLYEFGKVYHQIDGKRLEEERLMLLMTGNQFEGSWKNQNRAVDYFDVKGVVWQLFRQFKLDAKLKEVQDENLTHFKIDKQVIATLGTVSDENLDQFDIDQAVFFVEIASEKLIELLTKQSIFDKVESINKFPAVDRDLSILIDHEVSYADLVTSIQKTKNLVAVDMLDVYRGEGIAEDKKSYTLSFSLQSETSTLNEKQIGKSMSNIQRIFETTFGAEVRS